MVKTNEERGGDFVQEGEMSNEGECSMIESSRDFESRGHLSIPVDRRGGCNHLSERGRRPVEGNQEK